MNNRSHTVRKEVNKNNERRWIKKVKRYKKEKIMKILKIIEERWENLGTEEMR